MATVSLRDYLSTSGQPAPSGGVPATGPGLVPLRDVLAGSAFAQPRPTPAVRPAPQPAQTETPPSLVAPLSLARTGLSLGQTGTSLLRTAGVPGLREVGGTLSLAAGAANIPLSILRDQPDVSKALGAASGLTQAASGAATLAPETAASLLGPAATGVLPYVGALFNIAQGALQKGTPDAIKAANAAIDAAAAIAAPFTFGLSAVAAPVAKAGVGNVYRELGGTGQKPDLGQTVASFGPLSGPAKAAGSLFGLDMGGTAGRVLGYLDPIAGPLSLVAGMFDVGKASQYAPKRAAAVGTARAGLGQLSSQIAGVKTLAELPKALEMSGTPAPFLEIPQVDLARLGLTPSGKYGGGPEGVAFSQLTTDQFRQLLDLTQTEPDRVRSWVAASGDVPYLPYEQAVAVQQAARNQVFETLRQAGAPPPPPVSLRDYLATRSAAAAPAATPEPTLSPPEFTSIGL